MEIVSLAEIQSAIEQLSFEERAKLAAWFHGWKDDEWDDGSSLSTKAKRSLNYQLRSCCLFDFAQDAVELAARNIALHGLLRPSRPKPRTISGLIDSGNKN